MCELGRLLTFKLGAHGPLDPATPVHFTAVRNCAVCTVAYFLSGMAAAGSAFRLRTHFCRSIRYLVHAAC